MGAKIFLMVAGSAATVRGIKLPYHPGQLPLPGQQEADMPVPIAREGGGVVDHAAQMSMNNLM